MTRDKPNDRRLSHARSELGYIKVEYRWVFMKKSTPQYECRRYHKTMRRHASDVIEEQLAEMAE